MTAAPSLLLGVCVVTYQERFEQTAAFASLSELPPALRDRLRIVSVCNAAPADAQAARPDAGSLPYAEWLRHDNPGLAGGFNDAVPRVLAQGVDAVLFLNADSVVPGWYVEWLFEALAGDAHDGFAPTLHSGPRQVSPFRKRGMPFEFYIIGYLCLRAGDFVRTLQFPSQFWLDGIDYWLSAELARAGMRIAVDPRSIRHNLSVSDQFHSIPAWRYRNILLSERTFLRSQQRPFREVCIVYLRALARCLRFGRMDLARVVAQEFGAAWHE